MTLKKGTVLCKTLKDESHNQVLHVLYGTVLGQYRWACVCVFFLEFVVKRWLTSSILPQRATGKPGQVSCCCSSPGHSDCLMTK